MYATEHKKPESLDQLAAINWTSVSIESMARGQPKGSPLIQPIETARSTMRTLCTAVTRPSVCSSARPSSNNNVDEGEDDGDHSKGNGNDNDGSKRSMLQRGERPTCLCMNGHARIF